MDIEKTVKSFLTREHIRYSLRTRVNSKTHQTETIIHCEIEHSDYNIMINEKGLLSVTGTLICDKPYKSYYIIPKINELNQNLFGSFYWHSITPPSNYPDAPQIFVFYCQYDQLCINGITVNEQLVEDIFIEVHKGLEAIANSLPEDIDDEYYIDPDLIIPDDSLNS